MGLDYTDRGVFEKIIDHGIKTIPDLLPSFRDTQTKSKFQITNPEEFCYGHITGRIFAEFASYYVTTHGKMISNDEIKEIGEILEKRSRDIKTAIFNCG